MKRILIVSSYAFTASTYGGPIKSIGLVFHKMNGLCCMDIMYKNTFFTVNLISGSSVNKHSIFNYNIYRGYNTLYLNSFFSFDAIWIVILKKIGIVNARIVLAPRGELSGGALSIKSIKKTFFIDLAKSMNLYKDIEFHATSDFEKKDISKIFCNKVWSIPNFISFPNVTLSSKEKESGELHIVYLSRITRKKNLEFALDVLSTYRYIGNIVFDIYGSIEELSYWEKCIEKINILNEFQNINVSYKGVVHEDDVYDVLKKYECFFLPTLNENFGHAIIEAMQCGLLPLLSDKTPWSSINQYNAGWAISILNKVKFADAIQEAIDMDKGNFIYRSNNVKKYLDSLLNVQKIQDDYRAMLNVKK